MYVAPTTRLRGLGQCAEPVSCGIMAGAQLAQTVINYWKQQSANNRNKVIATEEANAYSRAVYGLQPECSQPTGGIPVIPGTTDYKFCEASVAGLIERCRIDEAAVYFGFLVNDMQQLSNQFSYFRNWFNVYGIGMVGDIQAKIMSARQVCGAPLEPFPTNGGGAPTGGGGVSVGVSFDTKTLMLLGAGLMAVFIISNR